VIRERSDDMMSTPVPPVSPEDENPASELKTDVVHDVEREHTITSDVGAEDDDED
jgi:hypothetical protein